MKKLFTLFTILMLATYGMSAQDIIELEASQSMGIAGKGPGQDGAINPYLNTNSIAIVENIGENTFSIRVQKKGEVIKTIAIKPNETKEVTLLKGFELYFDTERKAKTKVSFKKGPIDE